MFSLILSIVLVGTIGTATVATAILPPRQTIRRPVPAVGIANKASTPTHAVQRRQRLRPVSAQSRENQGGSSSNAEPAILWSFPLSAFPDSPGLYALTNRQTGAAYIGEAVNILQRLRQHRSMLARNAHFCRALQEDFNSAGIENFEISILEQGPAYQDKEVRKAREKHFIRAVPPEKLYNMLDRQGDRNSFAGRSHSQEFKDRLSVQRKSIPKPELGLPLSIPPFRTRKGNAHPGGTFPSLSEASRVTGIARRDIRSRLNDPRFPDWHWLDVDSCRESL